MNKTLIATLLVLCLAQNVLSACPDLYWKSVNGVNGKDICVQCAAYYAECSAAGGLGTYIDSIEGYNTAASSNYCGGSLYYDSANNYCRSCMEGCSACFIDYDYCTDCEQGYVWNGSNGCNPVTLGLEAAALAFLIIGMIIVIVACIKVNKAKK